MAISFSLFPISQNGIFLAEPNTMRFGSKKTGGLTQIEKKSLKYFKKIAQKYGFSHYLGIPFITESDKNVWPAIKKWVKSNEYKVIRDVFDIFEKRFKKIWKPKILKNNIKMFKKESQRICYKKNDKHLEYFFGKYNKNKFKEINVYLLKDTQVKVRRKKK